MVYIKLSEWKTFFSPEALRFATVNVLLAVRCQTELFIRIRVLPHNGFNDCAIHKMVTSVEREALMNGAIIDNVDSFFCNDVF